jgi:serine/threonine protein kinase
MRNADPKFIPPEINFLEGKPCFGYDPRSGDIWALGVILYMLIANKVLFQMANVRDTKYRRFRNFHNGSFRSFIQEADPQFTLSKGVMVLLENMLQIDPTKRWNIQQILRHDPIQELLKRSNAHVPVATTAADSAEVIRTIWERELSRAEI